MECPSEFGIYDAMVVLEFPDHVYAINGGYYTTKDSCAVDVCMVDEIQYLWQQGIVTTGCCCGHGITDAMINVADCSIQKMIELGYRRSEANDYTFLATSKHEELAL
ncbi:hypothetical protein [Metasolibacillus sp.]|uniref:hypothetical protein n=1 Tax=Metasolibacillus sp. TaxID=2703680 RepID=UPI0025D74880|nr:hypothetical protein [Metasolibacillus sp.]MCT6925292.1 hypothetical protein [Metasolibacillus sp.]MCT6941478.1 hypothetical protein [Metasolibacillus sp.]